MIRYSLEAEANPKVNVPQPAKEKVDAQIRLARTARSWNVLSVKVKNTSEPSAPERTVVDVPEGAAQC